MVGKNRFSVDASEKSEIGDDGFVSGVMVQHIRANANPSDNGLLLHEVVVDDGGGGGGGVRLNKWESNYPISIVGQVCPDGFVSVSEDDGSYEGAMMYLTRRAAHALGVALIQAADFDPLLSAAVSTTVVDEHKKDE